MKLRKLKKSNFGICDGILNLKIKRSLNEVDIENVSPMTGVSNESLRERQDMVNDGGYSDKIVSNAPEKIDDTFTVPKVIE